MEIEYFKKIGVLHIFRLIYTIILLVVISTPVLSAETLNPKELISQIEQKMEKLEIDVKRKIDNENIELANNQLELANRIIDWSAMFFAALAALIVIAGAVGLKEFSKIRKTEKNMSEMLVKVREELESIRNYKSDIIDQTKKFMEVSYYYNQGVNQYHSENYLNARELFYKLLAIDNNNLKAYLYIGKSLMMEGNRNLAEEVYRKMVAIDDNSPYAYVGIALNCYETDKDRAIKNCNKAYELDADDAGNLESLAYIYRNLDDLEKSFNCAMRSHNIAATATNSFFIALLYYSKKDKENAYKYLDESKYLASQEIEKASKVHWGYFKISVVEALNNKMKKAKKSINKSLKYNSSRTIVHLMKSDLEFILKADNNKNIKGLYNILQDKS